MKRPKLTFRKRSRRPAIAIGLVCCALAGAAALAPGQEASFAEVEILSAESIRFTTAADPFSYYILQDAEDLFSFSGRDITLGEIPTVWDVTLDPGAAASAFLRVQRASVFQPLDSDGDFIDDLYELNHPQLNPFDANDALLDPDADGFSFLQEYLRALFGVENGSLQFYSREVSAFNIGARVESALSREFTTFNFGEASAPVEAISAELSLYNGSGPQPYPQIPQAYSRELTTFNLGSPSSPVEAISAELSLYNGSGPQPYPEIPQAYSRELTAFNLGEPSAPIEAISREVSVLALVSEE